MTRLTEGELSDGAGDVGKPKLEFPVLAKGFVRQDSIHDFVNSHADGNFVALSGSKSDVVTLELNSKFMVVDPFPYFVASLDSNAEELRPLDALANQVDLVAIYDSCDVLEAQHLALEPGYTAVCSQSVPPVRLVTVKRAPNRLANGNLLLASLNTYGSLSLMDKPAEYNRWGRLEELNVAVVLRDTLLPQMDTTKITNFKQYQALINRAWITMFTWIPDEPAANGQHVLILGTASGSLWLLTLSADAKSIVSHQQTETSLGRICYIHAFKDLLLVGAINGLIHLYQSSAGGLMLVKTLWEKADRLGLQMAVITQCAVKDCYYITCCKAAHLLTWCMPRLEKEESLAARLYVGGVKITGLCSLDDTSYAAGTATSHLQHIQIVHENNQLSLEMQSIAMDGLQDFQLMGLCTSENKNLITMFLYRNKEYLFPTVSQKKQCVMQILKVGKQDALAQLSGMLEINEPIDNHIDLLAELRLDVFSEKNWQKYIDYGPLGSFQFTENATESQLQQLQLKFHVLQSLLCLQSSLLQLTVHIKNTRDELQLLLAMLFITHIRLRLQFFGSLSQRTRFQEEVIKCMFMEAQRLISKLKADYTEEHVLGATSKTFVDQIGTHLQVLHDKLGKPVIAEPPERQVLRCTLSFVEITPSLDRRYCSLCDRSILFELENLQELYDLGRNLTCPVCHGSFAVEMLHA
ncbi:uncharacterized protein LOC108035226 [Drosophila biarmipes]|uniref:uncharacterized protein LOC108035226 n=1 Tax=Drosophila biarmipes TaxID=125945 RepID=UPI0007E856DB|nr:uncharacterized protein LOC108035226 [Drosophila biarmipes]